MFPTLLRDWMWIQSHGAPLTAALVAVLALAAMWRSARPLRQHRRGSWARVLRAVAIPLVLLWESQGLFLLAMKVHAPRDMAYVLAGVTSAVVLTFAAYADEHFKRHGNLGPAGRWMWYVAAPMGLVVAANSRTLAEAGLRIVLPLLSVAAFAAAYVPDEPEGRKHAQGSWRLTPRRAAVALGLIDPADTDLISVHAERRIRQLTAHASGYHRGARALRWWHGWRFERLTLMADDAMVAEAARRVKRVHTGLAATAPEPAPEGTPEVAAGGTPQGTPGGTPQGTTGGTRQGKPRGTDWPESRTVDRAVLVRRTRAAMKRWEDKHDGKRLPATQLGAQLKLRMSRDTATALLAEASAEAKPHLVRAAQ
jgi:hypothetical protein